MMVEGSLMVQRATARTDFVPHLPDLLVSVGDCWRSIRDAQTEVDPFGASYVALGEARMGLEALAHHLTGQYGFLALGDAVKPRSARAAVSFTCESEPN